MPLRMRVAAAFALAMAIVLAATGAFLYSRVARDLANALDQDLRLRAQDIAEVARDPRGRLAEGSPIQLVERGESFAQLVTPGGRVLDASSPLLREAALVDVGGRRAALGGPHFADLPQIPGLDEGVRLLSIPVVRGRRRLVLVVGATAENRREALRNLRDELLIAGPIALVLATLVGYLLAGSGLRAVDAMRARAERISADRLDERLPVPRASDELQRLGLTLNSMLERLQAALDRERGFVADAAHELRTPLALLRAELDYAVHYADNEEELRAAVRAAGEETDRLVALAGSLLLIASSDRGKLELQREGLAVGELLDSVRRRFAWRAAELGRPLEIDAPESLTVRADRLRLEQALGNLVDNALRHGAGTVRMSARAERGELVLSVSDAGEGFAADVLSRAFERFSRGRERGHEGAGLGLAIASTIAHAHGGSAEADNSDEGGARVAIRLPHTAS